MMYGKAAESGDGNIKKNGSAGTKWPKETSPIDKARLSAPFTIAFHKACKKAALKAIKITPKLIILVSNFG